MNDKIIGHYSKKHAAGTEVDKKIARAVKQESKDNEIPCAIAFKIADKLEISPAEIGSAMDLLEIRLIKCGLGLFGYSPEKKVIKPAENVSQDLENAIRKRLIDGKLPCKKAWAAAGELGVRKMEVSSACEKLKIKISSCQLGAFQ